MAVALLWAAVIGLGLEVTGAWRMRAWEARGAAYYPIRDEAAMAREAAIWREYGREPITVGADLDARRNFRALAPDARASAARDRHELVALCDAAGTVTAIYGSDGHPVLDALARRLSVGDAFANALEDVEAADARQAMAQAVDSGAFQSREYPLDLAGHEDYVVQVYFWPYPDAPAGERLGVFVRDSMWEVLWGAIPPECTPERQLRLSHQPPRLAG